MAAVGQLGGMAEAGASAPSSALPGWIGSFWGVAAVVAAYRLAYAIPVALASPPLGMDNVADNVWAQQLRLVYQLRQPPLYEWLLWPVQQLTGPNTTSFLVVKTVVMTLAAVFLLGAARYAIRDRRMAAIAVFSYGLFYNVGWTMLERLTQSSLLLCCCAATAWLFARALRTRRLTDHLLLGLALGAGLLSKFNFALFALGLLVASFAVHELRRRLRPAGLGLALLTGLVVASPFLYGLAAGHHSLASSAVDVMEGGARAPYLARAGEGLGGLAQSLVVFSLALIPLAPIVFWSALKTGALPPDDDHAAYARLFGKTGVIVAALAAAGIVLSGSLYLRDWHVLPAFAVLPLWMFARIERGGASASRLRSWTWITAALVAGCAVVNVIGAVAPDSAYCGHCGQLKSYPALAQDLERMGAGVGTLVALDPYTAGNLRAQLPRARIVTPGFSPVGPAPGGSCLAVWETDAQPRRLEQVLAEVGYPSQNLVGSGRDAFLTHFWRRQWLSGFGRSTTWGVRPLSSQAPLCR